MWHLSVPADTYAVPAPVTEYVTPTPTDFYAAPARVIEHVAPAPVIEHIAQLCLFSPCHNYLLRPWQPSPLMTALTPLVS